MNTLNLLESITGFENAYNIINNQLMQKVFDSDHTKPESQNIYLDHLLTLKNIANFSKIKYFENIKTTETNRYNPSIEKVNHQKKHAKVLNGLSSNLINNLEKARFSLLIAWHKSTEKKIFCHKELDNYLIHFKQYCENINTVFEKKSNYDALLNFYHPRFSCEFTEDIFKKISTPLKSQYVKFKEFFKTIKTVKIDSFLTKDTDYKYILNEIKNNFGLNQNYNLNHVENNLTIFHDSRFSKNKSQDEFQNNIINDLITEIQNELNFYFFNKSSLMEDYNAKLLSMTVSYFLSFHLLKSQQYIDHLSEIIKKVAKGKGKIADSQNLYWLFNRQSDGSTINSCDDISRIFYHMLQYVIEKDLINGKIKSIDLPEIWSEGVKHYFGVDIKPEHLLQDTHISMGKFGSCALKVNALINSSMIFAQYETHTKDKTFNVNTIKQLLNNINSLANVDYTTYAMLDKTSENTDVYLKLLKNRIL